MENGINRFDIKSFRRIFTMKKALALALALVFVFALAIPTFALEKKDIAVGSELTEFDGSQDMTVTYNVSGSYTLNIPASVELTYAANDEVGTSDAQTVSLSKVLIPHAHKITVAIGGTFAVVAKGTVNSQVDQVVDTVGFEVYKSDNAETKYASGDTVLELNANGRSAVADVQTDLGLTSGAGSASNSIVFKTTEYARYNAAYTGTVTFTVAVTAQADAGTP